MDLKKIIGTGAIAGALGFSAIGLAGVANAAPSTRSSRCVPTCADARLGRTRPRLARTRTGRNRLGRPAAASAVSSGALHLSLAR